MLSIGKLGAGHYAYYEASVADGREDYYAGAGEERGEFVGDGSRALGFEGQVEDGDLKHLFQGTHPDRAGKWLDRRRQKHSAPRRLVLSSGDVIEGSVPRETAAFDLTFSAPKSVSVLWALGDADTAAKVKDAHERAYRQALFHLEKVACIARRGGGGRQQLQGEGFVAAAFNHRSSRAGDPQLHTHVVIVNATRADGRYTALHGAALYREARTAGYVYQAVLRGELSRRLGVRWGPVTNGQAEIEGVDRDLLSAFSKRSDEIVEQLERTGQWSAKAANAAALDTRAAKDYFVDGMGLKARWLEEARAIGAPDVSRAVGVDTERFVDGIYRISLANSAFAPDGLTRDRSTFARRDLIRLACEQAQRGASVYEVHRAVDDVIDEAGERVVWLDGGDAPLPLREEQRFASKLGDGRTDVSFTTRELLDTELSIIAAVEHRAGEGVARVPAHRAKDGLDALPGGARLAPDQQAMVEAVTTSGDGIEVVVGLAGAGKTFSLNAAREIWEREGIEVRGCSTALAAAKNLESEAGIASESVAMLKRYAEIGDAERLSSAIPRGGVLIVDEAGMVSTRDLAFLVDVAGEHGTKLVLVGDHRQLPEIEAGGTFGGLVHRLDADDRTRRLTVNRRQRDASEREALGELRSGDVGKAVAHYVEHDRITTHADGAELRRMLANDWLTARDSGREVAMIAYTRRDVDALNSFVRNELDRRGALGEKRVTIAGREWAHGDELLCLSNNRNLGIENGTRGTVVEVRERGLTIEMSNGTQRSISRDYLERGRATYGWATTGHKAQGLTVDGDAFVLASEHLSREWLYVAMSRAKDESRVYVDTIDRDPATGRALTPAEQRDVAVMELYRMAERSSAQSLAADARRDESELSVRDMKRLTRRTDLPIEERARFDPATRDQMKHRSNDLVAHPPEHLRAMIGSPPSDIHDRREWARDAMRLEQQRKRRGIAPARMTIDFARRMLGAASRFVARDGHDRPGQGHGHER